MSRKDYRSVTLSEGLYLELEKFVAQSNGYYVSIAKVVREALRDYLRKRARVRFIIASSGIHVTLLGPLL
ncbi:MAG: ribbon-helix-helix domain-containing protein [Candidatus Bathyarchaeota archaeon]|nr:ribbon-helix-helix domain-containing protein [Candidatus Bathyarchaeota archaeon]